MNVNKKLDRFRQWGKEKVGAAGEKTQTSDDFKALQAEMDLRHEGMEKLQSSMNLYVKSLNKKSEADGKDRYTPMGLLGAQMSKHGEAFEDGSSFGDCLISYGQTHQRIARLQESYAQDATSSWLEGCERSVAQMKDYQGAKKKLESRRLAYDASLAKMQKSKKDDFRAEEELRSQRAKYEESTDEVSRRMQDIVDTENDNVADLYSFLECQLAFHERARDTLLQLQKNWPAPHVSPSSSLFPRHAGSAISSSTPSRASTRRLTDVDVDDVPSPPVSRPRSRAPSSTIGPNREPSPHSLATPPRPAIGCRTASSNDATAAMRPIMSRTATEASASRSMLRSVRTDGGDPGSYTDSVIGTSGKRAPPPPPSRKTKPPPPPPPMKRAAASAGTVPVA